MKKLYILLTRSETILSRAVHLVTRDRFTHASLAFDDEFRLLYSSSRKNGRTLFPAGPCREDLDNGYYSRHKYIPCAVYELEVSDEVYDLAKAEVARIMEQQSSYHFNIIGLLLCHLGIPYHRKYYFFCSQFVSEILSRSNALDLPKVPSLMKPSDIMTLPELLCLYQGNIAELSFSDWK